MIADLSVNHVERFVLRCGWTVQRTAQDYGIDLFMKTFNVTGEPDPGEVLFQIKSTNRITFAELRRLLLEMGFFEYLDAEQIVFRHEPSDTLFVFRRYRPQDPVASYNLMDVSHMLDARGLMSTETFESQFRKTSA